MKDYEKMINTVKALNEVFGDKEFTRRDYECKILRNACVLDDMELNCGDILGVATVLDLNHSYIVRKVREEDFITKNSEGKKVVGTRFYYEVNSDFMKELKKDLEKEIADLKDSLDRAEKRKVALEESIARKKTMIAVFETLSD